MPNSMIQNTVEGILTGKENLSQNIQVIQTVQEILSQNTKEKIQAMKDLLSHRTQEDIQTRRGILSQKPLGEIPAI